MSTPQWAQDINALNTTDTDLSPSQTIVWGVRMKTESDKFTAIFKGLSIPLQNAIAEASTAQTLGEDAADKRLSNLTRADAVANLIQTTTAGLAGVVGQVIRISNSTGGLDTTPINMGATLSINETTGDPFYIMTLDRKDAFGDSRVLEETRGFPATESHSVYNSGATFGDSFNYWSIFARVSCYYEQSAHWSEFQPYGSGSVWRRGHTAK